MISRKQRRQKRHLRVRKKAAGSGERPRLCIMVSNRWIYAQLIDDDKGVSLASLTTLAKGQKSRKTVNDAKELGKRMAEVAKKKDINRVIFDRGGFAFHGRVKAFADTVREAGLKF